MDKISIKMPDISGRTGDASKSGNTVKTVTDDFKKLLQEQGQREESKEVSKDTQTEKKPENPKEEKDTKDIKDEKDDTVKGEEQKEDKSNTDGLLAVFQMSQGFRPEVIQAEPEVAEETAVSEIQLADTELQEAFVQTADAKKPEVQLTAEIQTEPMQKTEADAVVAPKQPEATGTPEKEVRVEAFRKEDSSSDLQNNTAQHDSRAAEQPIQAPVMQTQAGADVYETKQPEPVRMYVPQPEQLPDKLTDQLLTKMSEGIQEFEIHIEPANLGKIAVKILYQEGQATVSIVCSEKRALDVLGRNAGEIGQVIEKNLGGITTIIVDKQESDYLNQTRDENQKNGQNGGQEQKKDGKEQNAEEAEQFLQKLRLGLAV